MVNEYFCATDRESTEEELQKAQIIVMDTIPKITDWGLNKGQYDEIDSLPLMATPGPVLVILTIYLLVVLKIGPAFMSKREAFNLKTPLILYNGLQVALSVFLAVMVNSPSTNNDSLESLIYRHKFGTRLYKYGIVHSQCLMDRSDLRREVIIGIWLYFAAKVTELLDTIFFVLRKKNSQVTFLHLYHHSAMVICTWAYLKYAPSDNVQFIGFLNSVVHVFMYTYYGLAAMGPQMAKYLVWKKYMTSFQLIQFVSIFVQYLATLKYSSCPPSKVVAVLFTTNILFFLVLFTNFYLQSYKQRRKPSKTNDSTANGKETALKSQ